MRDVPHSPVAITMTATSAGLPTIAYLPSGSSNSTGGSGSVSGFSAADVTMSKSLSKEGWRPFVSGYLAAMINISVTFPINKTMFRQQLHGVTATEALHQLRSEGLISLYRGLLSPLLQKSCTTSIMFGTYEEYTRMLHDNTELNSNSRLVVAALLAGTTEATLTPFERVQCLMQHQKFSNTFRNTPHAFQSLWSYGFKEYYRGLTGILLRNGPSNVIFFAGREKLSKSLPENMLLVKPLADFISGACLGAFISTLMYPVNTTKTHMQKTCGGKFRSFHSVFFELLKERGGWGMFKGVHINYTRSFISWGITNVTYEYLLRKWTLWDDS